MIPPLYLQVIVVIGIVIIRNRNRHHLGDILPLRTLLPLALRQGIGRACIVGATLPDAHP